MPLWTNLYNGPGNGYDGAYAMAVDTSGNVYVAGFSVGSGTSHDYATIKYSSAGTLLWVRRYNGPANYGDMARAVALDPTGNVYVTGSSENTDYSKDYVTIKYSGAGVPLWTNRYNGPGNYYDYARAMAVDSSGNVMVAGSSANSNVYPFNSDYVTIAYSSAGVPLWTNRYNGPVSGDDEALAMAVDTSGNVFVTGSSPASAPILTLPQ